MGLARYANKRDENEPEIVDALRQVGATVGLLDVPCDLLVGFRGVTYLLEVKMPAGPKGGTSGREFTPGQAEFAESWRGRPLEIVRSVDEALRAIGAIS